MSRRLSAVALIASACGMNAVDASGPGASDAATLPPPRPPAIARLEIPANPTSGAAASFAAEISDPDALVARVEWTFGDGESASDDRLTRNGTALGTAVEHTFTATGTYAIAVSVTVTGGTGNAFTVL